MILLFPSLQVGFHRLSSMSPSPLFEHSSVPGYLYPSLAHPSIVYSNGYSADFTRHSTCFRFLITPVGDHKKGGNYLTTPFPRRVLNFSTAHHVLGGLYLICTWHQKPSEICKAMWFGGESSGHLLGYEHG